VNGSATPAPARPRPGTPPGALDLELTAALPDLPAAPAGRRTVPVLVRVHGHPVGRALLPATDLPLTAHALAARIWPDVRDGVAAHLAADGRPAPTGLDGAGLPAGEPCSRPRRPSTAPRLSVVVATRDRTASLLRTLESLAEQDYPGPYEVVVVDNAPSDDTTARAVAALDGRLGGAALRYVAEPVPGLAQAHNAALDHLTGTWVAFTDDDVVVDESWLSAIATAAAEPGTGCVTGPILAAEVETRAQELLEQYGGFARGFVPRRADTGRHHPGDPLFPLATGRLGSGANMAFDTALLRRAGGFDPALGAGTPARGGDDLAGLLAVLMAGRAVAYEPAAVVWHWHRREYTGLVRQTRGYGVGLGAYLTSALVRHPALVGTALRRAVPAVRHLVDRGSAKNAGKPADFPRGLERAERLGVLLGPWAYLRSRTRRRPVRGAA
jgi:GT2 family glycosyltransferase